MMKKAVYDEPDDEYMAKKMEELLADCDKKDKSIWENLPIDGIDIPKLTVSEYEYYLIIQAHKHMQDLFDAHCVMIKKDLIKDCAQMHNLKPSLLLWFHIYGRDQLIVKDFNKETQETQQQNKYESSSDDDDDSNVDSVPIPPPNPLTIQTSECLGCGA